MRIYTLELIHRLLIDEYGRTKKACESDIGLLEKYKEPGMASTDVIARQRELVAKSRAARSDAWDALVDFEAQEL